jgi:hypothetical protein
LLQLLFSEGLQLLFFELILEILFVLFFINFIPVCYLLNHIQDFLSNLLIDYFEGFCLLECLSVDIQRQVVTVDHTHDEGQVLRHQVSVLLGDQHSSDVKFQVVLSTVIITVKVMRDAVGDVQNRVEYDLTVSVKVNPVHRWVRLLA